MPKRSNDFQRLVFLVKKQWAESASVTESKMLPDRITGKKREVDVCIESRIGGHDVIISIECIDHKRIADVTWVEKMRGKHERLPTNVLVFVSRNGFTPEAQNVAHSYGFETLCFNEVNDTSINYLFGRVKNFINKSIELQPRKVLVRLEQTNDHPPENIQALPDNMVYRIDGSYVCTVRELVDLFLTSDVVRQDMWEKCETEHNNFTFEWENPHIPKGGQLFLRQESPQIPREIIGIRVMGKCVVKVSEFPLQHGMLGNIHIAWGRGRVNDKDTILVATEDELGSKRLLIRAIT